MKQWLRGLAAWMIAMSLLPAMAADGATTLSSERDKVSYVVGMDLSKSLAPVLPDVDLAAFERSLRNTLADGEPLLDGSGAAPLRAALSQRVAVRNGQPIPGMAPGTEPPPVDKGKVGLLIGADIGRSLAPAKDEIDVGLLMQALRAGMQGGTSLLSEADSQAIRAAFGQRMQAHAQADAANAAQRNAAAGAAFLAKNRAAKGVFTTRSGLQYMVLKQGTGPRPLPQSRVRVNYTGKLLDGTVFDSSDTHGGPAEFGLDQVIAGWTEGLAMMPVGSRYRLWIPGSLGYGTAGSQGIGPNSTLVFDVELVDIR